MKKNLYFFLIFTLVSVNFANAQWNQIGTSIEGEYDDDLSGNVVSMNSDGLIIAIGSIYNDGYDGDSSNTGHVRVYEFDGNDWAQLGSDIDGDLIDRQFGLSISLDSVGKTIAISERTSMCQIARSVKVYDYNGSSWEQKGNKIYGEYGLDNIGTCLSLSSNGNYLAIGADDNPDNGTNSGHVRVFEYLSGYWSQVGNDIDGEAANDYSGRSVDINSAGNIVAIGAEGNDGNGTNSGQVRVFENINGTWTQLGIDIDGEAAGDLFGCSVDLNSTGNILAVGAKENDGSASNSGHARVFEYIGGVWVQLGIDLDGAAENNLSGSSVGLNYEGNIIAVGAPEYGTSPYTKQGYTRIYKYVSGNWVQDGGDIFGANYYDHCGISVELNSGGNTLVIGSSFFGNNRGHVRVFNNCISYNTINVTSCEAYTSPSGNYTWSTTGIYQDIVPNNEGCDSIITINLISNTSSVINEEVCDVANYTSPSGNYTWVTSGTYQDTITNNNGCDSVITFNLTMNYSTSSNINITSCNSYTSPSGNYTWATSGTYNDIIPNSVGCDSNITVILTINNSTSSTIYETVCNSYTSPSGNHTWTISGTYQDVVINTLGCDSNITVELTINPTYFYYETHAICENDSFVWQSNTYNEVGLYNEVYSSVFGCDSIYQLNLTLNVVDTTVIKNGNTLTANLAGAQYQWLYCDSVYTEISGENEQSFTPLENGNYAVVIINNCTDTSSCHSIASIGIPEYFVENTISLFPNPANNYIYINSELLSFNILEIIDVSGKLIKTMQFPNLKSIKLNVSGIDNGVYFVKITTTNGVVVKKLTLQ